MRVFVGLVWYIFSLLDQKSIFLTYCTTVGKLKASFLLLVSPRQRAPDVYFRLPSRLQVAVAASNRWGRALRPFSIQLSGS